MFSLFSFSPFGRETLSGGAKRRRPCKPRLELLEDRNLLATWAAVSSLPTALGELASALGSDGRIYAIGGTPVSLADSVTTTTAYNTSSGLWTAQAPLNVRRSDHGAAAGKNASIYAFGGFNFTSGTLASAECYSVTANKWTVVASLNVARDFLSGGADSQGRIYAIGGSTSDVNPAGASSVVERYNPSQGLWTAVASMNKKRIAPAVATGADGKIYALGGMDETGAVLNSVECYSPTANTWTFVASMPTARSAAAAAAVGNRIVVIGGSTGASSFAGPATNKVESYNTSNGVWSTLPVVPTARFYLGAATGLDGRIYAVGGITTAGPATAAVEALSSLGGFSGAGTANIGAALSGDLTSGPVSTATVTVAPLSTANSQWVVSSSGASKDTAPINGTETVRTGGADTLSADLTDAVFAGSIV
jgi:hypothetical protein